MNKLILTLGALGAAVASQAVSLNYTGSATTTTPLAAAYTGTTIYAAPFDFTNASVAGNTITLTGALSGSLVLTLASTTLDTSNATLINLATTATASGTYGGVTYSGPANGLAITSNTLLGTTNSPNSTLSIVGNVDPVPEPASFAALGVGAVALLRRRRA